MYTAPPILWYDVNRITRSDAERLVYECRQKGVIAVPIEGNTPPCGYVGERFPTPDELFRWNDKVLDTSK